MDGEKCRKGAGYVIFDKALVKEKLLNWEGALQDYTLPAWDALPTLPLYMDQVVYLLNQYLSLPNAREEERIVTPAMINNYVKLKIIPPPVKKRYSREHLAYLLMVCVMKQTLNTADIRKLLPGNLDEENARETYAAFVNAFHEMKDYFSGEVRKAAVPVLEDADPSVNQLIFRASAIANLSILLAEQLILLGMEELGDAGDP